MYIYIYKHILATMYMRPPSTSHISKIAIHMLGHVHCYFADVACATNENKHIQQPFESAN